MRGSIHYQTGQLSKVLYHPGMPKHEQKKTGFIANSSTLNTYREVWNELATFTKLNFSVKDLQNFTSEHIENYMLTKASQNITEQRFELISSAIGKLEIALRKLNEQYYTQSEWYGDYIDREYDFSIRHSILQNARAMLLVKESSDDPKFARNYEDPIALIEAITDEKFKLAAMIQYESGARVEGVERIDKFITIKKQKLIDNNLESIQQIDIGENICEVPQLQGIHKDKFDDISKGHIFDIEKGGKPGILQVSVETYQKLEHYLKNNEVFKIDINQYRRALMDASKATNQIYHGSHGLRWNFAKERFQNLQIMSNLTYEQALQQVSWEMKHERANITEHYLR